jgi:hypothetical protein
MYKTRHNFTIHCQPYCLEVKLNADFSSNYLTTTAVQMYVMTGKQIILFSKKGYGCK